MREHRLIKVSVTLFTIFWIGLLTLGPVNVQSAIPVNLSAFPALAIQNQQTTVYITRTGAKYHRGNCRYLYKSKIPVSLKEAQEDYLPCSVCRPPRGSAQATTTQR